jgi:hypothetical protein
MTFKPLEDNTIEGLLTPSRRGGGKRKPKNDERTLKIWFGLDHKFGNCENEDCISPNIHKVSEGADMVSEYNGKKMCRYCFLGGYMFIEPESK